MSWDEFQARLCKDKELLTWLRGHGAEVSGVEVRESPGKGCGVFATRDFEEDEEIMSIPAHLAWSVATAQQHVNATETEPGEHNIMELAAVQRHLGKKSHWRVYLDHLPEVHSMTHPALWTDEELAWFEGSEVTALAKEHMRSEQQSVIRKVSAKYAHLNLSVADVIWAWGVTKTRMHPFNSAPPYTGMIPFADYINYADKEVAVNTLLRVTQESRKTGFRIYTATATQDIDAGMELLVKPLTLDSIEMLNRNGVARPNNKHDDRLRFYPPMFPGVHWGDNEHRGMRLKAFDSLGFNNWRKEWYIDEQGVSLDFLNGLRIRTMEKRDEATAYKVLPRESALSEENEVAALEHLMTMLQERSKTLNASTIPHDIAALSLPSPPKTNERYRLALIVRLADKKLLIKATGWAQEQLEAARKTLKRKNKKRKKAERAASDNADKARAETEEVKSKTEEGTTEGSGAKAVPIDPTLYDSTKDEL